MDPLFQSFADGFAVPDERPIYDWAKDNIELPPGGYAIHGPFNIQKSRHLIGVFDALQDERIYRVNVLKATQTGGTLAADIFVPWTVANRPGPILWNWHTGELAKQHAETRAMPVIKTCKALQNLLPDDPRRLRNQEVIFKHGIPVYIQGPSAGNLQGKSIRYLINDEVWQWKPGRIREAQARTSQYKKLGTAKELNISQAGIAGDDWDKLCTEARFFQWRVPCPECGFKQSLTLEEKLPNGKKVYRLKWDETGSGDEDFTNERYVCANCAAELRDSDAMKASFNEGGEFVCLNPDKQSEAVTFHWTSLIWRSWREVIKEYRGAIKAKRAGVLFPLIQFLQKEMAVFWNDKDQVELFAVSVRNSDYDPREQWSEEKYRFLTVDCQADLIEFWAVIRAWSGAGASRRLWRGRLDSFEAIRNMQVEWGVRSQFVILDSGYRASEIYRACCRYVDETGRGWVAMKGSPSEFFTHNFPNKRPERRIYSEKTYGDPMLGLKNNDVEKWLASVSPHALALYKKGALKCPLYLWSNPSVKEITQNLIEGRGGDWLAPVSEANTPMEEIYRKHLAGEILDLSNGKREFKEIGENHLKDCEQESTVAAIMAGCFPLPKLAQN
jgi:hypothetical protein